MKCHGLEGAGCVGAEVTGSEGPRQREPRGLLRPARPESTPFRGGRPSRAPGHSSTGVGAPQKAVAGPEARAARHGAQAPPSLEWMFGTGAQGHGAPRSRSRGRPDGRAQLSPAPEIHQAARMTVRHRRPLRCARSARQVLPRGWRHPASGTALPALVAAALPAVHAVILPAILAAVHPAILPAAVQRPGTTRSSDPE